MQKILSKLQKKSFIVKYSCVWIYISIQKLFDQSLFNFFIKICKFMLKNHYKKKSPLVEKYKVVPKTNFIDFIRFFIGLMEEILR